MGAKNGGAIIPTTRYVPVSPRANVSLLSVSGYRGSVKLPSIEFIAFPGISITHTNTQYHMWLVWTIRRNDDAAHEIDEIDRDRLWCTRITWAFW